MATVYDKSSLFLAPSGVSNGTVFVQKPVPIYGSELVTNGNFASDSDWTKGTGWSISGGIATLDGTQVGSSGLGSSTFSVTSGKTYKVVVNVISTSSGFRLYDNNGVIAYGLSVGKNVFYRTVTSSSYQITPLGLSGATGSIDNVSVKEVLSPDGDFTFTRGSNLSATRVNEAQLIEKGRENLLLQSNQFDTTWGSINVSETGGQAGYDGTNDAWVLTDNTATDIHSLPQYGVWPNLLCTGSIYVKAGSLSKFYVSNGSSGIGVFFNLSNGSVEGVIGAVIAQSITSVGGDWYRLSVTMQSAGTFLIGAYQTFVSGNYNASINYTGTGTGTIYIQDAQLEQGLAATSVITTGGGTVQAGLLENTPRLDYSGGATCPSLLLEPSRTNLLVQSEYYNTYWSLARATINDNDTTSPEGKDNASALVENNTLSSHPLYKENISVNSSASYTVSVFIKKGSRNYFRINPTNGGSSVYFNINTGVVHSGTGKIESYGNDWFRCSTTWTTTGTNQAVYIEPSLNGSSASYLGDGSTAMYIYGAQLEAASYATSYIPTYGTSQTRAGEICNSTEDATTINSTEGVLYFEVSGFDNDGSDRYISISDGTLNNAIRVFYYQDGGTTFFRKNVNGAQTTIVTTNAINKSELTKIAVKYNSTNFDIFSNGVKISTNLDSNSFPISTLNEINFSNADGASQPFYGKTKQLIYFPTALSDLQLAILTGATTYETFDEMALALNYTVYE